MIAEVGVRYLGQLRGRELRRLPADRGFESEDASFLTLQAPRYRVGKYPNLVFLVGLGLLVN